MSALGKIKELLLTSFAGLTDIGLKLTFTSAVAIGVISLTAAAAAVLVTTFAWVVVFILLKSNSLLVSEVAGYSTLIAAGCGAVLGLLYIGQANAKSSGSSSEQANTQGWKDWRNFVVVRKVKESAEITSFYLEPQDKREIPNFKPGQFLTIRLDIEGQAPVIRTYSLSDYREPCKYYRLSVKRELPPEGSDVPSGLASNFMHDQVQEGSVIPAKPPTGRFALDVERPLPVALISNGVGITPMISMVKAVSQLNPNRTVWFVHGARDGTFHAFHDEVSELAKPNLHVHFAYSRPRQEDAGKYQSTGYVDTDLVRSLVGQEAEYFLCGSEPFLESIRAGLKAAGIPEDRVFFESFLKGGKAKAPSADGSGGSEGAEIVFDQSGKTATWKSDAGSLLDFAEANGLNPPFSCRQGICGTCESAILEGEVEYLEEPTAEVKDGSVLICICAPKTSKVVLKL